MPARWDVFEGAVYVLLLPFMLFAASIFLLHGLSLFAAAVFLGAPILFLIASVVAKPVRLRKLRGDVLTLSIRNNDFRRAFESLNRATIVAK